LRDAHGLLDGPGVLHQRGRRRQLQHVHGRDDVPQRDHRGLRYVRGLHDGPGVLRGRWTDVPSAGCLWHARESPDLRDKHRMPDGFPRVPGDDLPYRARRRGARGQRRPRVSRGRPVALPVLVGLRRAPWGRSCRASRREAARRDATFSRCPRCRATVRAGVLRLGESSAAGL
jgi:hypothetical protein